MKEYIKKFSSANAADNYHIVDIPFTSTVWGGGTLTNLTCNEENKKIVVDSQGNISIVDAGPEILLNNQIKYTANSQLSIKDSVDYIDHTFDNGVGIVTFDNDLTTLGDSWFVNTFDNYIGNITSFTLPNGVKTIGIQALSDANTVYYEGTQKECARIEKNWIDGTGVSEYHCFDGIVNGLYISNRICPLLGAVKWFKDLIEEETLDSYIKIISSVKIDETHGTAGEFIRAFVNGTKDIPGLSKYEFIVDTLESHGVTIPVARHTKHGYFVLIVKAIDYAHLDLDDKHIAPVAVNESLDPNYMYLLYPLAIDFPDEVNVTIRQEDGSEVTAYLNPEETYSGQGYNGYYSQDTYDSGMGEMPENYLVDNNYPAGDDIIYDYCNDSYIPADVTVTINHEDGSSEDVQLDPNLTYAEQDFSGYYSQDTYDSSIESDVQYYVDGNYPYEGEIIYDYCNDTYEPEPEPTMVSVTINHYDGDPEGVMLDSELTYVDQGYTGYYSQNIYNSGEGESPDDYLVDGNYPYEGEIVYDYCNPA